MKKPVVQRPRGKIVPSRGNSKRKGPEAGIDLYFQGQQEGFRQERDMFSFSFQKITLVLGALVAGARVNTEGPMRGQWQPRDKVVSDSEYDLGQG